MRVILQSKNHSTGDGSKISVIPPTGFNCKAIYLTSVTIPYSFYNIRDSNNTVTINGVQYKLDQKNYNSNQLASALNTFFEPGVIVKFDKQYLKYKITNLNTEILNIQFNTSYRLFGFDKNIITTIQPNTSVISGYIGDINDGIHSLILTANFGSPFSCLYGDKFGTNIIARIPILVQPGSMINYSDINTSRPIAKNVKIDHFEIELFDDDRIPLPINGLDYQVELYLDLEEEVVVQKKILTREKEIIEK